MKDHRHLMARAMEYAGLLVEGTEIVEETDGPVVEPFRHLLGPLLFARGLYLEKTARGERVTSTAPWLVKRLDVPTLAPVWCCRCSRSLFDENCVHGIGYVVRIADAVAPRWLQAGVGQA